MTATARWLQHVGRALATFALYDASHPSRTGVVALAHEALLEALRTDGPLRLSLVDGTVIAGAEPLTSLPRWEWGGRLAAAGVQRIEVDDAPLPTRDDVAALLAAMRDRLDAPARLPAPWAGGGIRIGPLAARVAERAPTRPAPRDARADAWCAGERAAVAALLAGIGRDGRLPLDDVRAIAHALAGRAIAAGRALPRRLDAPAPIARACNVAMLAVALGDRLGIGGRDRHELAVAALLRDVGHLRMDPALQRAGPLAADEVALVRDHPVVGARLLLDAGLDPLVAVVALEHHRHADGRGGYPALPDAGVPHFASRVVAVADVYDAMVTDRPWCAAIAPAAALDTLDRAAGTQLDHDIVRVFRRMAERA